MNEKSGGLQRLSRSSLDLKNWIVDQGLIDIPLKNGTFTWNNKRQSSDFIAEKLDRFFILGNRSVGDLNFQSPILPYARSDHFPVCLELSEPSKPARNPFKCEKMWFQDLKFIENIKSWWRQADFEGSKMFIFISKLKSLKENMLRWNRLHFNNIFKEKIDIEEKLKLLNQDIIRRGMNFESYSLEKELLA